MFLGKTAIFDLTWTLFWPQKAQINNSLRSIFAKKDRNYIINFMTLTLTKVKFLKTIIFCHFWCKLGKILALISLKCGISSYIWVKFPLRCLYNHFFGTIALLYHPPPWKLYSSRNPNPNPGGGRDERSIVLLLFALKGISLVKYEKKLLLMPVSLPFPWHWT